MTERDYLQARTRLLAVLTVLGVLTALYVGRSVVLPVLYGVFIIALVLPLQDWLDRQMPKLLASVLSFLAVLAVLLVVLAGLAYAIERAAVTLASYSGRLAELYEQARGWSGSVGVPLPQNPMAAVSPGEAIGQLWGVFGGVWGAIGGIGLALAVTVLGLPAARTLKRRLRDAFDRPVRQEARAMGGDIASALRSYTGWTALVMAINGVLTWAVLALLGVELAILWGALAFIMTVIPFVGAILTIFPPTLLALAQFDGLTWPLAVFAALTVIQVGMGNFVEPVLQARSVQLMPVVALLSVLFWAFLLGLPATIIAVPLTAAVVLITMQFEATRWIATLLTEEIPDSRAAEV